MDLTEYITKNNLSDRPMSDIQTELSEAVNNGIITDGYVTLYNGKIHPEGDAWQCENTNDWYTDEDNYENVVVRSSGRTEMWCDDAVNDEAFYCEHNHCYYSSNAFTEVDVEGDTVCYENVDCYEWNDGTYHWEEEHDEEADGDDIPDYHSCSRPWEGKNYGKKLVFGCELEMKAKESRGDVWQIAKSNGLIGERDGSLCDTYGIEIIGEPMSLDDYKNPEKPWLSFLKEVKGKALGHDAGSGYGIHISINRRAMSSFHTGKLLVFIHENEKFCEKIAGRGSNNYSSYTKKKISHGQFNSTEKYDALSLRGENRLELRIFRSTLKPESFLRNVEFTAAAVEYTRNCSYRDLNAIKFTEWLSNNHREYKNLALFLGLITAKQPKPEQNAA